MFTMKKMCSFGTLLNLKVWVACVLALGITTKYHFERKNMNPVYHLRAKREVEDDTDTEVHHIEYYPQQVNLTEMYRVKGILNKSVRFRVCSVSRPPIQNITKGKKSLKGFSGEILNNLATYFNFSFRIILPHNKEFKKVNGSRRHRKKGMWQEMVNMLQSQDVDFCAAMFPVHSKWRPLVDFSPSIYLDEVAVLLTRGPGQIQENGSALIKPFTPQVWRIIGGVSAGMVLLFYCILRLQRRIITRNSSPDPGSSLTFSQCIWFVFSVVVKQGCPYNPRRDSTRILYMSWWITAFLLTSFYSANLTAYMTLPPNMLTLTLRDMLDSTSGLRWIVERGSALDAAISDVKYKGTYAFLRKSYYLGRKEILDNYSDTSVLRKVLSGDAIFLHESAVLNYLVQKDYMENQKRCRLRISYKHFSPEHFAFAYKKNFTYAQAFNQYIVRAKGVGLLQQWQRKYLIKAEACSPTTAASLAESNADQTLSLEDLGSAFMSYGAGLAVALTLLLTEWTHNTLWSLITKQPRKRSKRKQKQREKRRTKQRIFSIN